MIPSGAPLSSTPLSSAQRHSSGAAAFVGEESSDWYSRLGVVATLAVALAVGGAEELPAAVAPAALEEASWAQPSATAPTTPAVWQGHDEGFVAGTVEEAGEVPSAPRGILLTLAFPNGEELPLTASAIVEEAGVGLERATPAPLPFVFTGGDEAVLAGTIEEASDWVPSSARVLPAGRAIEVAEEVPASLATIVEETGVWAVSGVRDRVPVECLPIWRADGEGIGGALEAPFSALDTVAEYAVTYVTTVATVASAEADLAADGSTRADLAADSTATTVTPTNTTAEYVG